MVAQYSTSSPYYFTPQNSYYLGVWRSPGISPSTTDEFITVSQRYLHRPDLLSYDLYGTPRLWWVFALLNQDSIKDPIYDLEPGIELRVPSATSVRSFLG
jgi:hypothetical protein